MRTRLSQRLPGPRDRRPKRRDRRGRGLRGPLAPPQVPLTRTRAERFDDLVLEAVQRIERRFPAELASVEFAVEDVPEVGAEHPERWRDRGEVPLSGCDPAPATPREPTGTAPKARIVIYRRPLESRAVGGEDLELLVHGVVVEEVARFLGLEPEIVDPHYGSE